MLAKLMLNDLPHALFSEGSPPKKAPEYKPEKTYEYEYLDIYGKTRKGWVRATSKEEAAEKARMQRGRPVMFVQEKGPWPSC